MSTSLARTRHARRRHNPRRSAILPLLTAAGAGAGQSRFDTAPDEIVNRARVPETNFELGRMSIHVHVPRVHFKK